MLIHFLDEDGTFKSTDSIDVTGYEEDKWEQMKAAVAT